MHPRDRKENNHEEMDVDYPEQEASSFDEEESVSSSASEDGDTSGNVTDRLHEKHRNYFVRDKGTIKIMMNYNLADMDDEDCERRRMECLDEMTNLEKQFTDLKDQ